MSTDQIHRPDTPADERAPIRTERERELIVTNNGGGSNGVASAVVAILAIVALLAIGFFTFQAISSGDIDTPDNPVDVEIDNDSGTTGDPGTTGDTGTTGGEADTGGSDTTGSDTTGSDTTGTDAGTDMNQG